MKLAERSLEKLLSDDPYLDKDKIHTSNLDVDSNLEIARKNRAILKNLPAKRLLP